MCVDQKDGLKFCCTRQDKDEIMIKDYQIIMIIVTATITAIMLIYLSLSVTWKGSIQLHATIG